MRGENNMADEPMKAEIILYQSEGANVPVEVQFAMETFWLTQKAMAELFDVDVRTISEHIGNIFESGELEKASSTVSSGISGKTQGRPPVYYNLDVIIAVGYRVNSLRATRFRQWATTTLREYITKGFVLNDDMLKNGQPFGRDYFDELLARIRDIRASERRVLLSMEDCDKLLDSFLQFNGRGVLPNKGSRNRRQAEAKARAEFAEFQKVQDATYENDFEKMAKKKLRPGVF